MVHGGSLPLCRSDAEAVRVVMKQEGLRAIAPKSFKPKTTDSKHNLRISDNLLKNPSNEPKEAGEVLIGDITYLPLKASLRNYTTLNSPKV